MAEVTIPDYPKFDQKTLRLSQIRVSLSTIGENEIEKRALPLLPAIVLGYIVRKVGKRIIRYIIKKLVGKIVDEIEEIARSLILHLGCEAWYNFHSTSVNRQRLPPCPCKRSQANRDDRFEKESILHDLSSYFVFKNFKNKYTFGGCYSQSNVG